MSFFSKLKAPTSTSGKASPDERTEPPYPQISTARSGKASRPERTESPSAQIRTPKPRNFSRPEVPRQHITGPVVLKRQCMRDCAAWKYTHAHGEASEGEYRRRPPAKELQSNVSRETLETLYKPIQSWQSRIVELLPGSPSAQLQCRLETVDVVLMEGLAIPGRSQVISYEALSYSWRTLNPKSESAPSDTILCNGMDIPLSMDVCDAFEYLRRTDESRYIWCDVLCINQVDLEEKARQVRNLLQIFEKAQRVIAWMGLSMQIESDEGAVCSTRNLFAALQDQGMFNVMSDYKQSAAFTVHSDSCWKRTVQILKFLILHFRRPWFSRTFIRQEVFASRELEVQCGSYTISFDILRKSALEWINLLWTTTLSEPVPAFEAEAPVVEETLSVLNNGFQHRGTDHHDYRTPAAKKPFTTHWLETLHYGCMFGVTDERDRIYAHLGMLQSSTTRLYVVDRPDLRMSHTFPIDYKKSVSEVYQDVVKYLISVDLSLDTLTIFEDRSSPAPDLPSWVPDWRKKHKRAFWNYNPEVDKVGNDLRLRNRDQLHFLLQDFQKVGELRVHGVQLGNLVRLDATLPFEYRLHQDQSCPAGGAMSSDYIDIVTSAHYIMGTFKILESKTFYFTFVPSPTSRPLSLCVPRIAMIDDIVVHFYPSRSGLLFLVRPTSTGRYKFLGPVVSNSFRMWTSNEEEIRWANGNAETFILI